MSKLIGGKEALIALTNGKEVEVRSQFVWKWVNLKDVPEYRLIDILENKHCDQFRLKHRTITINGIEVPKPFEPKEGDVGYVIDGVGVWRTEAEIKQVVVALRKVFKGEDI